MNTGIRIGLIGGILAVSLSGAGAFKENIKEPGNAFAGAYAEEAESDFFVRKIEDSSFNVQGTGDSDISGRETANAAAVVKKIDGKWYYLLDGKIQKCGWATVGGKKYYFNKDNGTRATGLTKIDDEYYIFNDYGKIITTGGSRTINGVRYTFNKKGKMTNVPKASKT